MLDKKILVLGGDMRLVTIADSFARDGCDVKCYGFDDDIAFDKNVTRCSDLSSALLGVDIVVTGLPVTNDDLTVRTPLFDGKIYFYELFTKMKKHQILLCGKATPKIMNLGKIYEVTVIDYFIREEMAVLNCIPTAEGAVEIAMKHLPITIHGSKSLVLGFGRVGKQLAKTLLALGSDTYVEARKFEDLAWISAFGYHGVPLRELEGTLKKFDVIFNTVPHEIMGTDALKKIKKDCLLIDLASLPGGIDREKAEKAGLTLIQALSLPGKVAPRTAGEIIKQAVENIMTDLGV